jgi:uncharacterized membrane protein
VTAVRHAEDVEEDRGRSAERLITFTDAVVAIAITLLALPLAEIGGSAVGHGVEGFLHEKGSTILGFVISFFVIARLWWGHHRIFQHVQRWDGPLVVLTVLWLFTIVLLPPATALTTANIPEDHPEVIAVYIGVMAVSSALLTALARHVVRRPSLTDGRDEQAPSRLVGSVATTVGFVIALVVGTAFPAINYFAIFVLVLTGRLTALGSHLRRRRLNVR